MANEYTRRRPAAAPKVAGLLLAHGAGGGADHGVLVALQDRLEVAVRRMEFSYRSQGRRFPDRAPKLIDEVRREAEAFAADLGTTTSALVLGGRSLGGRMCSMAVAGGLEARGLALLSYPLHPPGRPERLRTEHFALIKVPTLFVGGDRDPFGTPGEFDAALGALRGVKVVHWLEGQGHDPKAASYDAIVGCVRAFLSSL